MNMQGEDIQGVANIAMTGVFTNQHGSPVMQASDVHHSRNLGQGVSGTPSSVTIPIGEMLNAGTIKRISAFLITACTGDATVTVDIKKNGTTVLSSVITISSAHSAREVVAGTLNVTTFADGDVLEAVIVANAGTGSLGTGLRFDVFVDEQYNAS